MKRTIIFSILLLLASYRPLQAQSDWDAVLDRYSEICSSCIELREMIGRGENVPSDKISSLLSEMKLLREKLGGTSSGMTPRQRKRYAEIRDSYASHFGTIKGVSYIEKKDNYNINCPKVLKAEAFILDYNENLPLAMPSAPTPKKKRFHPGIAFTCTGTSDFQYGVSMSGRFGKWGAYLSAMSNFSFTDPSYFCNSSGKIEGGGAFWGDGSSRRTLQTICAGPTYRVCRVLDIYAGVGYAEKKTFWKDLMGEWAGITDLSCNSIFGEAGARLIVKSFCISCGVRYDTKAGTFAPTAGLGYEF